MKRSIIPSGMDSPDAANNLLQLILKAIDEKLDAELLAKQLLVEKTQLETDNLRFLINEKNTVIHELSLQLTECNRKTEGHRQLVNKLLKDIERLQQDIEWYKRTYETRSLLGTIKEKILRRL